VMPEAYRRAVEEEGRADVREEPPVAAAAAYEAPLEGVGD